MRRQAQLLHARPDLAIATLRGNVQTRLDKLAAGDCAASLLALAGLKRLGLADARRVVLDPEAMVPAAGQGIVGITVRADDTELRELLAGHRGPRGEGRVRPPNARCWRGWTAPAARRSAAMRGCCRTASCT